jgi:hypothetical protein
MVSPRSAVRSSACSNPGSSVAIVAPSVAEGSYVEQTYHPRAPAKHAFGATSHRPTARESGHWSPVTLRHSCPPLPTAGTQCSERRPGKTMEMAASDELQQLLVQAALDRWRSG